MALTDILSSVSSLIDDIPGVYVPQEDLENTINTLASNTVLSASLALVVLTIIAIFFSEKIPKLKLPLFVLMTVVMAGSTITLIASTVYLNVKSESGGPIHWHADFEFWACGNELELRDPTGTLSNKIGTSVLHEHDDHRVHLEGVAVDKEVDASIGKFMHVIGGAITNEALVVPLNAEGEGELFEDEVDGDGPSNSNAELIDPYIENDPELGRVADFRDGDTCGDLESDVQTFVYRYDEETKTYEQSKIDNPQEFVIYEDPNVPPGDCIIFEFGPEREKTDKLCEQYGIRDIDRCEQFGVEPQQREICELTQLNYEYQTIEDSLDYTQPDEAVTTDNRGQPDAIPSSDLLDAHPCRPFYDDDGNPTGVEIAVYDDDGNLIDPLTDCDDFLEALEAVNGAAEEEAN